MGAERQTGLKRRVRLERSSMPLLLAMALLTVAGLGQVHGNEEPTAPEKASDDMQGDEAKVRGCPYAAGTTRHTVASAQGPADWWPNALNLRILHQGASESTPLDEDFDYAHAFTMIDLPTLKQEIEDVLTTPQAWWPPDYGHYGPLMIRLAWHSAGTYRVTDGRGGATSGTIRFAPLNSWPDNANLDKARRLLWPIKQKYGQRISWADLMVLTGNVALESMGFETLGFGGGRKDVWQPELDIDWGPETEWLGDKRHEGERELKKPLGATQMGLIYVNPEGPGGTPDPLAAAKDIRATFARMAMNDEETVALIAGGHTLGKCHGAAPADGHVSREPEAAPVEAQGLGWHSSHGRGKAEDTITSGLEGAWTTTPAQWSHDFFEHMFKYEWELTKSPAGAWQWKPKDGAGKGTVPDAHRPDVSHAPMMLTTDLALRFDPIYGPISKRFRDDPEAFRKAFAKAWFKLTHRDMGPHARLLGPEVPEAQPWQDPVPAVDHPLVGAAEIAALKEALRASGLSTAQLVRTAWASASSYRGTDRRGGANGARLRLEPQRGWAVNGGPELAEVLGRLEAIQARFAEGREDAMRISLADLIVLGGAAAIEHAAKQAGRDLEVPFAPGRTDATQAMTDVESFAALEPAADGFRGYRGPALDRPAPELLVDRAHKLTLTVPEMTVLLGGMRALGANVGDSKHGVLTERPGTLSNDFFVNLLDMGTAWAPKQGEEGLYEGRDRADGTPRWTATDVDLVFGSNSQLRGIAEVYASSDGQDRFVRDFVRAWVKVMRLDRSDM